LDVGFEYGKITGRSLMRAMASITCRLKLCGIVLTPTRTLGRTASTMSARSLSGACGCAKGSWNSLSPVVSEVTRPRLFTSRQRACASASESPSRTTCWHTRSAMPTAALPAPKKRYEWSRSRFPRMRFAPKRPATATDAVPWMSSLKQQTRSR
jgi:hypothetical protein